jgi:hypothetical protein
MRLTLLFLANFLLNTLGQSTQDQVNSAAYQYVLYYMGVYESDAGVYPTDLSGVCTLSLDGNNQIVVNGWTLGASYAAPTNTLLLTFTYNDVLAWFNSYYTEPAAIANQQSYSISTSDLALVRTDSTMIGYQVFDSTARMQKVWSGSSWITFDSALLTSSSAWSNDSVGITFTANTPRLVPVTGFTQSVNTSSGWAVETSTGKHTYTGHNRTVRISINYSVTKPIVLTTQTLTTFLSKNGGTTINGKRMATTFVLSGLGETDDHCLSAVVQVASGDTLQLGASYSATLGGGGISFSAVSYDVNG